MITGTFRVEALLPLLLACPPPSTPRNITAAPWRSNAIAVGFKGLHSSTIEPPLSDPACSSSPVVCSGGEGSGKGSGIPGGRQRAEIHRKLAGSRDASHMAVRRCIFKGRSSFGLIQKTCKLWHTWMGVVPRHSVAPCLVVRQPNLPAVAVSAIRFQGADPVRSQNMRPLKHPDELKIKSSERRIPLVPHTNTIMHVF